MIFKWETWWYVLFSVVKYTVEVYTGKKSSAGTDANVFLCIFGELGDTGRRHLTNSSTNINKFEKGQVRSMGNHWINLFWIHEFISLFIHSSFFLSLNLFPDNISLQYSYNCKIFVGFFSVWCVWNWGCDLGEDKKDRDRSWRQRDRSGVVSGKSCHQTSGQT